MAARAKSQPDSFALAYRRGIFSKALELAMKTSCCRNISLQQGQRPRLLSRNGPCFIADELIHRLARQGIQHGSGAPARPKKQKNNSTAHLIEQPKLRALRKIFYSKSA
jgi:hypothetical protein